jgi:hypothetical protein
LKIAAQIGISYDQFLKITPRVLNIYIKAYTDEKKEREKELVSQAYLISRWVWQKNIDIDKILKSIDSKEEKQKQMTDDQLLAQAKALNALFGGEVKTVGEK